LNNIHCFCQPNGWKIYTKQEAPTFFVSTLTDIKAQRRYCACLTFLEPLVQATHMSSTRADTIDTMSLSSFNSHQPQDYDYDDSEYNDNSFEHQEHSSNQPIGPCKRYVPKCLIIVSHLDYFELFKSLLLLIYGIYVDNRTQIYKLETIVTNMLNLNVHTPGTALLNHITLGADDKHIIQSNASLTVPNTGSTIFYLFKELGRYTRLTPMKSFFFKFEKNFFPCTVKA
jgi:myotubularin-related protein 5/13